MNLAEFKQQNPAYAEVPDEQLAVALHRKFYSSVPFVDFARQVGFKGPDPTEGMSGVEKFTAAMGGAVRNMGRGVEQMYAQAADAVAPRAPTLSGLVTGQTPSRSAEVQKEITEARQRDKPLLESGAGVAGNIVGSALPFVATARVPGANTYTGAALGGAIAGAIQPTVEGESRLSNTAIGAALGGASQGVANAIGTAGRGVKSTLNPEERRLAQVAALEGIPLSATQQTGNRAMRTLDAAFENIPSTAGAQARQTGAQTDAFNRAVLSRAGIAGERATPDVLAAQRGALGSQFEQIAGRNSIDFNQGALTTELSQIVQDASRRLPPDTAKTVANTVDDILSQVNPQGALPGTNYQGWRSDLGKLSRGNDTQAHYFAEIKRALDRAFSAQVPAADAAAWQQASREYGNLKTISGAMGGAGVAPNAGNISPAQLAQALASSVGREGKALGRGDLNDLSRVGNTFLRQQVPDSGTARRLLAQGLLTGGAGYGVTQDPQQALMAGAAGMAAPALARSVMYSAPAQRAMTQGVPALAGAQRQALIQMLLKGGVGAAPALNAPAP